MGALIDIIHWPAGYEPAGTVVALDASGHLLFCEPGERARVLSLPAPPSQNWGSLAGLALDTVDLYLLDPTSNAVWLFASSNFAQEPRFVFGEEVPMMQDVIDMAVNRGELYLLHSDGHITLCELGIPGVSPTRCIDQPYIDYRPGRENQPMILANPFTQLLDTPPPDPSLYLLEPQSHAIYHFSLRNLAFQRQYLPQEMASSRLVTAFYVNPVQRYLYLAIGSQVYYAVIP